MWRGGVASSEHRVTTDGFIAKLSKALSSRCCGGYDGVDGVASHCGGSLGSIHGMSVRPNRPCRPSFDSPETGTGTTTVAVGTKIFVSFFVTPSYVLLVPFGFTATQVRCVA